MTSLDHRVAKVALGLYQSVGSEVSTQCAQLLRNGDLRGLISMKLNPSLYTDPHHFKKDYACVEFLRKCNIPIEGIDRREAALKNFWEAESQCCQTNVRFSRFINNGPFEDPIDIRLLALLEPARMWVKRVLGKVPDDINGRFGPGTTFGAAARRSTIPDKISTTLQCTREAIDYVALFKDSCLVHPARRSRYCEPEIVPGNRFTTVPKDALKDRGICIEPSFNVFAQLGVGRYIRQRLKQAGLDLIHGQDMHRQMAQLGSLTGDLATIDLSNASDTLALKFIRWLLPPDWYQLLENLRSPKSLVNDKWVVLEKFSSMGNGYTFELETLVFAAICFASGAGRPGKDFWVYGDDMIVPTDTFGDLTAMLTFCGFSINTRKSFDRGPFRESCGGDFFNGVAVRPYYLKELPHGPEEWISLANGLRRLVCSNDDDCFRFSYPYRAWLRCLDAVPSSILRCRGPIALGDLVLHDEREKWSLWFKDGIRFFRVYRPVNRPIPLKRWDPHTQLAAFLYGCSSDGVIPRGAVTGYKIGKVAFS